MASVIERVSQAVRQAGAVFSKQDVPGVHQFAAATQQSASSDGALTIPFSADQFINQLSYLGDFDDAMLALGVTRLQLRFMEGDDEISGALDTRRDSCVSTPWFLDGEGGEQQDFVYAELLKCIKDILRYAWEAVPYGYAIQQIYWGPRLNQRTGIDGVRDEDIERFRIRGDELIFLGSGATLKFGDVVDQRKLFITVRNPKYHRRHGDPLLSKLYWPWFFRTHGWNFWMKYLERFGTPFLVGKTNGNTQNMATQMAKAVQDAVIAIAKDDEVTMIESGRNASIFTDWNHAVSSRIAKTILGQTLTSDVGKSGGGSLALGKVHSDVLEIKRVADSNLVTGTVQRIIDVMWAANKFTGDSPKFTMIEEKSADVNIATRDKLILDANSNFAFNKQYYLDHYEFDEEDFILDEGPRKSAAPAGVPGQAIPADPNAVDPTAQDPQVNASALLLKLMSFAAGQSPTTPVQDNVDAIAQAAQSKFSDDLYQRAANEVKKATGPADLQRRITALAGNLEPGALRQLIDRAVFAADVLGYVGAKEGSK